MEPGVMEDLHGLEILFNLVVTIRTDPNELDGFSGLEHHGSALADRIFYIHKRFG